MHSLNIQNYQFIKIVEQHTELTNQVLRVNYEMAFDSMNQF